MSGIEVAALAAVAGTGMKAIGEFQAATQQAKALGVNAQQQRQAGHNEMMAGQAEAARIQDQGRRQRASAFNALAGSGVDAASGTGAALMDDLAAGSALDASIARWRGTQAQAARNQQAAMLDWERKNVRQARWWRAGSTLLTAGGRTFAGGAMGNAAPDAGRFEGAARALRVQD